MVVGAATVRAGSATAAGQAQGHARRLGMITAMHYRRRGAARVGGRRCRPPRRFGLHGPPFHQCGLVVHGWWTSDARTPVDAAAVAANPTSTASRPTNSPK